MPSKALSSFASRAENGPSVDAKVIGARVSLPHLLLAVYLLVWTALAIDPLYRQDWALENLLVAIALPLFVANFRHLRFTNGAYLSLFIFFTGSTVSALLSRYEIAKYLFFSHDLVALAQGMTLIEDVTLPFAAAVLGAYAVVFLVVSYLVFSKRDVTA